jgi:vitamin-K-epoxide reductase (warfarin-sensitive)
VKYIFILLAILGIVASSLALREHYRTDTSPCSINDKWDCGAVNHSPYAVLKDIPVAAIGIAGYILLGTLGYLRAYPFLLIAALSGLGFSLYLTDIEAHILGVWCIYCVSSLAVISLMALFSLGITVWMALDRRNY